MSDKPIGVFDSGIGGLSTLKALHQLLPNENFIYVADLAWAPYGNRTSQQLLQRGEAICEFLMARHCKAIVIACNTATAAAVSGLRQQYRVPIIGVEPGIKPATTATLSGIVGILATEHTLASDKFNTLLRQFDQQVQIIPQACPGLAKAIETGPEQRQQRQALLQSYVSPLLAGGADTLVLGCTHYPLIIDEIQQAAPDSRLIDTSSAIARQVVRQLLENQIINNAGTPGDIRFFTSMSTGNGNPAEKNLGKVFSYYWEQAVDVTPLPYAYCQLLPPQPALR